MIIGQFKNDNVLETIRFSGSAGLNLLNIEVLKQIQVQPHKKTHMVYFSTVEIEIEAWEMKYKEAPSKYELP